MAAKKFQKKPNFLMFCFLVGLLIFVGFFLISYPKNIFFKKEDFLKSLPTPAPYPKNSTGKPAPILSAKSVVVMDVDSGSILLERNFRLITPPASTTKIMSALIVLENYNLDQVIEVKDLGEIEGQTMKLLPKELIKVENLLCGLLVASANDAAIVLAKNFPNGEAGFVWAMNQKAKELKLENTNFTNPVGFDDPNHFSTAFDLARLGAFAMRNPEFAKIVGTEKITVSDVNNEIFHHLLNINSLVGKLPGVKGVKTGWTQAAGECLVTFVEKNGRKVIFVILGSTDRFRETEKLINWVFENFQWENFNQ